MRRLNQKEINKFERRLFMKVYNFIKTKNGQLWKDSS